MKCIIIDSFKEKIATFNSLNIYSSMKKNEKKQYFIIENKLFIRKSNLVFKDNTFKNFNSKEKIILIKNSEFKNCLNLKNYSKSKINIIFENCTFNKGFNIFGIENSTFINCKSDSDNKTDVSVKRLTFKNCFLNLGHLKICNNPTVYIENSIISAKDFFMEIDNFILFNSTMNIIENTNYCFLEIFAKNTILFNSKIISFLETYISSKKFKSDEKSLIKSLHSMTLDCEIFLYKGFLIVGDEKQKGTIILNNDTFNVFSLDLTNETDFINKICLKRQLLSQLKQIEKKVTLKKNEEIKSLELKLNKKEIDKILKNN